MKFKIPSKHNGKSKQPSLVTNPKGFLGRLHTLFTGIMNEWLSLYNQACIRKLSEINPLVRNENTVRTSYLWRIQKALFKHNALSFRLSCTINLSAQYWTSQVSEVNSEPARRDVFHFLTIILVCDRTVWLFHLYWYY